MSSRPLALPDWATNANYSTGPYPGFANKQQPSSGVVQEGFDPQAFLPAEWLNWILNNHGQWLDYHDSALSAWAFGDGSDGAAVLDGVATFSWATLSGSTYSLNRDVYLTNLTVNSGVTLFVNGFVPFATGTVDLTGGGIVSAAGNSSADGHHLGGGTTPSGTVIGSLGNGPDGRNASSGNGTNGTGTTNSLGGAGGAGCNSSPNTNTPGTGGSVTAPAAATRSPRAILASGPYGHMMNLSGTTTTLVPIQGGGGGGSGCSNSSSGISGGGGGGGGILIAPWANIKLGSTSPTHITAKGGDGGAAVAGPNSAGGGGGGGGGFCLIVYRAKDFGNILATNHCPGGVGGSNNAGDHAGVNGSDGVAIGIDVGTGTGSSVTITPSHVEEGNIVVAGGATATASFVTPFSIAPPTSGGYKFRWDVAVTDGGPEPTIRLTTLAVDHMTFTIDSDNFNGVISWRAYV